MTLELAPRVAQVFQNWFSLAPTGNILNNSVNISDRLDRRNLIYTRNTFHIYCFTMGLMPFFSGCPGQKVHNSQQNKLHLKSDNCPQMSLSFWPTPQNLSGPLYHD